MLRVKNTTHYYSPFNKVYNVVPESDSWQFESSKRLAYGQRLYWEYKYCKSVGGQAFFYTFTYNDHSLPYFEFERYSAYFDEFIAHKIPCFDYSHIRLITNGIISKVLRRKYGSQLRYFVACERGEGKGKRGEGQNPHYHVIFFVFPLSDKLRKPKDVPYKRISPISFCHLCKCVWQYQSTYNHSDYVVADYKSAKFGHCQPGNDLGLITDFDALSYVTKYVIKDSSQINDDYSVKCYFDRKTREAGYTYLSLFSFYHHLRVLGQVFDRREFLRYSGIEEYFVYRFLPGHRELTYFEWLKFQIYYDDFKIAFDDFFKNIYMPQIVDEAYRKYLNLYGSKVRTSKSLGIYGLSFVKDIDSNPHFVLDHSNKVLTQPISLYYYRKIYMDVIHCPVTGNPLYVLNQRGLDLKCKALPSVLSRTQTSLNECFESFSNNLLSSSLWSFASAEGLDMSLLSSLLSSSDFDKLLKRYCIYRHVYQYRHYIMPSSVFLFANKDSNDINIYSVISDYRNFLQSNCYTCDFSEMYLITLVRSFARNGMIPFSMHPVFSPYIDKFSLIEKFYDVYRNYISSLRKKTFDDARKLRQKLNGIKYSRVS